MDVIGCIFIIGGIVGIFILVTGPWPRKRKNGDSNRVYIA